MEGRSVGSRYAKHDDGGDEGNKAYEPKPFERPRRGLIASVELHVGEIELAVTAMCEYWAGQHVFISNCTTYMGNKAM